MIGSVATELLHSSDVPVVLAPEGSRRVDPATGITRITAAVGTRPGADALLEEATSLATSTGAELRLLSVCWGAQASAWQPPKFNDSASLHDYSTHIVHTPKRGAAPPKLAGTPKRDGDESQTTSGPRYTVCPSPKWDSRYQIDQSQRIVGGFATMGMGRYLDE